MTAGVPGGQQDLDGFRHRGGLLLKTRRKLPVLSDRHTKEHDWTRGFLLPHAVPAECPRSSTRKQHFSSTLFDFQPEHKCLHGTSKRSLEQKNMISLSFFWFVFLKLGLVSLARSNSNLRYVLRG